MGQAIVSGISTNTAQSASAFLDSIGVNVHMAYTWTSFNNVSLVETSLAYIGVDNVRDKLLDWSDVQTNYQQLADAGYKFDFVLPVYDPTTVNLTEFVNMVHNFVLANPGSVSAIEGANEVDIWPALFNGGTTISDDAALQRALYAAVNADPVLKDLPIYNTTIGYANASLNQQLGNLSDAADFANEHAYGWDFGTPQAALSYLVNFATIDAPGLPVVITETGYNTDTTDTYSGVDQTVQAKFTLDTLVDAYKMGVANTYLYELLDEPGSSWGLFNADGTPKLAATALHNFTTILHDPNATLTPMTSTLNYGLTGMPASGNQLLLEKGDGTFDLVLWAEAQIWDPNTQQEVAAPDNKVTVQFDHVEKTVLVYDPLVGSTPIATYTNISQLQVDLTDHPLIIEIPPDTADAPTIASVSPDTNIANDGITDANHLTLTGTADAGDLVQVFDGATRIGAATANASGVWTFATATLVDGNHAFTATATDTTGHVSNASAALTVTVDTVAPGAPTVASFSPDSGKVGDGITNVNHIMLAGTAAAGSTVEVFDGATKIGTASANAGGAWSFATATLADGNHSFTGKVMDVAGNVSVTSAALKVTVDTAAPAPPVLVSDVAAANNSVDVTGTAEAGSKVALYEGITLLASGVADSSGHWTINTGTLSVGAHDFTATATDAAGNVSAISADLDPVVGALTIESAGATELVEMGNNFFLNPVAGGTGPELMYGGTPFVAGAWTPIGAEKTAFGYEVALFNASSQLYTVWNTDGSGNVLSASVAGASGTNTALEALETSFHQDINGDGTVGAPGTSGANGTAITIESFGGTKLVETNNDYDFNPVGGGSGPVLMYGGTPFVAGAWAPVGVEKTSTGYEVALFNASSHLYTVWNTDSNGNVLSASISGASGSGTALESIETSFQQDLNGDGTIGVPGITGTTIEAFGATALVQLGNDYFLNPVAGGSGPELIYGGTAFVASAWAPVGVEKTSTGYEVALFNASSHLYTVWNTDGGGNVLSASISGASGTSTALESIEASFQQDLNGDGLINSASTVIEASGSLKVSLAQVVQPSAIDAGSTLELTGTGSSSVTFKDATGTLVLDHATQFTGSIVGLSGDGTAAHSDQIDLKDISYGAGTSVSFSGNAAGGILTVTDAQSHTAHLSLVGNYINSTFNLASDGNGGTIVIDPPKDQFAFAPTPAQSVAPVQAHAAQVTGDGFVFAHAGASASASFGPADSVLEMHADDHSVHQTWTETSHAAEFAAVIDHSHAPDMHHFMLH